MSSTSSACAECRACHVKCAVSRTSPGAGCRRCVNLKLVCKPARLELALEPPPSQASQPPAFSSQPLYPTPPPSSLPLPEPHPYDDVVAQWQRSARLLEAMRAHLLAQPAWRLAALLQHAAALEQALLALRDETMSS